jgi:site-specific DNA-methyltransferase (adenine-specific)
MTRDLIVAKLGGALALQAQARDATDAKQVADLARAAEVYARRQKLSEDAIAYATAVKVDALTLMGEFLKARAKNAGTKGQLKGRDASGGRLRQPPENGAPTLKEVGISKEDSWVSQAISDIQEEDPAAFEQVRSGKLSPKQAASRHRRRQRKAAAAAALPVPDGDGGPSYRVVCDDSMVQLPKVPARSARLAFADDRYNIGIDYGGGAKADRLPRQQYLDRCGAWMKAVARTLTADGSLWALINDESAAEFNLLLEAAGLHLRQWLVWYEGFGQNHANGFNRTHRHLLWAVVNPQRFVFRREGVSRASDRQAVYRDRRADPNGKTLDSVLGADGSIPRLTATCAERLEGFPTQLPLALLRPIIACASDPGDLVLDPFSGSATTGHAALESGRRYLGIEQNPDYAKRSRQRLAGVVRALADVDERGWRADERERRDALDRGEAAVGNRATDGRLIAWAEARGKVVDISRRGAWGNPFRVGEDGDRAACCDSYAQYLRMKPSLLGRVHELRGKLLCCYCRPNACHGDVLAKLANEV